MSCYQQTQQTDNDLITKSQGKPSWLHIKPPSDKRYYDLKRELNLKNLNTVCKEARCPNLGECWSSGTATIMILGDTCTRGCRFCSVKTGNPQGVVDSDESNRVALQVVDTNLNYVVITCVDRDDLIDGGAGVFADTIKRIKSLSRKEAREIKIEALISDYRGNFSALRLILDAEADVVAHNIETVERLTSKVRDGKASYRQSLAVLERVKAYDNRKIDCLTKSSIMVGLGESRNELKETLVDLKSVGVDIVTIGQYLRPSKHPRFLPVERYYLPSEFDEIENLAQDLGFLFVASGPLVRSSYRAAELFLLGYLKINNQ